jgi:glycosyltransferase involved in cell wall biosynthesis
LIPEKFPQWYDESESFRRILRSIRGNADTVIAISECTRRDWLEHSGANPLLATAIPLGVDSGFSPRPASGESTRVRARYGVAETPFVLAVGTLEPRKNLETLIRTFLALRAGAPSPNLTLLLVGPKGWKNDSLFTLLREQPEAATAIRLSGFVPDADLPWLYSACEVFVFPSLYEGFGLPVAEAMKCGAAVICGDNSSLPEVGGKAAVYVNMADAEALRRALTDLLIDSSRREALRTRAIAESVRFDWGAIAARYAALFASLAVRTSA